MDGGPNRRNKAPFFLKISAAFIMSSDCSLKLWRISCGNLNLVSVCYQARELKQ